MILCGFVFIQACSWGIRLIRQSVVRLSIWSFDFEESQVLKSSDLISLSYCSKRSGWSKSNVFGKRLGWGIFPVRFCIVFVVGREIEFQLGVRSQNGTSGFSSIVLPGSVKGFLKDSSTESWILEFLKWDRDEMETLCCRTRTELGFAELWLQS
ncbi:hypothetical protein Tco_0570985 [Tanacetum coccineum]